MLCDKRFISIVGLFFSALLAVFYVHAEETNKTKADEVYRYFASLQSFQANFTQTVQDQKGRDIQNSQGEVWISKPGKFRWNYESPYKQEVVANGIELWTHDPELEQATVKPIEQVLTVTPAMLLSGARKLHEIATIHPKGVFQNQNWYQVLPLEADETVDQVQLAFMNQQLTMIRVNDSFGNTTTIEFSEQKKNQALGDHLFSIELPAGTDILGAQ